MAKRVLAVLGLFALLFCVEQVVSYFVLPLYNTRAPAQSERDVLEGTIDTLLLGGSLTGDAVNAPLLEERIGGTVFNLASNAQSTRLSYYALQDVVVGGNPLKICLIEVSLRRLSRDVEEEDGLGRVAFSDYLMHLPSKMLYMRENYTLDDLPRVFVSSSRCQLKFFADGFGERLTGGYLEQILRQGYAVPPDGSSVYAGRGYTVDAGRVRQGAMTAAPLEPNDLSDIYSEIGRECIGEVRRAVELCQQNGIRPILYSAPIPDVRILEYQDCYEELTQIIQDLADELSVPFYDFNYSKQMRAQLNDTCFKDEIHMNRDGALLFTPVLAEAIQSGVQPGEFYATCEEMLDSIDRVAGVSLKETPGGVEAYCIRREGADVEYRFFIRPAGTDRSQNQLVQDWSPSAALSLEGRDKGSYTVRVEARESAHPERKYDAYARLEVKVR